MKTKKHRYRKNVFTSAAGDGNAAATIRMQRRIQENLEKTARDRLFPILALRAGEILKAAAASKSSSSASINVIDNTGAAVVPVKLSPAPTGGKTWFSRTKDLGRKVISKYIPSFLKQKIHSRVG